MLKLIYFGDGPWACKSLKKILSDKTIAVQAVVLRYDKPDLILKELAISHNLPVFCVSNVNDIDFIKICEDFSTDLCVSMSFDQIVKKRLRTLPHLGFINCHAGKLPFYRGRNILNWAIINDEKEFGITVHYLDDGVDTGDIIEQKLYPILDNDKYADILEKAYEGTTDTLYSAIQKIKNNEVKAVKQSHLDGSYFSYRRFPDEHIDWNWPARRIYNLIRAITKPGPGARTFFGDKEIVIWTSKLLDNIKPYISTPGEVIGRTPSGIIVKTGDTAIEIIDYKYLSNTNENPVKIKVGSRLGINLYERILKLEDRIRNMNS